MQCGGYRENPEACEERNLGMELGIVEEEAPNIRVVSLQNDNYNNNLCTHNLKYGVKC